jgi:uncharacterized membrane protein
MRLANVTPGSALDAAADALFAAAQTYWEEYNRGAYAAVVWVQDGDGQLVVMTRGEYTETLRECVETIEGDNHAGRR